MTTRRKCIKELKLIEGKRNDTSKTEEEYPGWWWIDEKAAKGEAAAADVLWQVGIRGLARVDDRTVRAILWTLVALHPSLNSGIMTEWAMVLQEWSDREHVDTLRAAEAAAVPAPAPAAVASVVSISPKEQSAGARARVRARGVGEVGPLGDALGKLDLASPGQSQGQEQEQEGSGRQKQKRRRGRGNRARTDAGATDTPSPTDDTATATTAATAGTKASASAGAKSTAATQQQQQQQQQQAATKAPIYRTLVVTDAASDALRVLSGDVQVVGMMLERMSQVSSCSCSCSVLWPLSRPSHTHSHTHSHTRSHTPLIPQLGHSLLYGLTGQVIGSASEGVLTEFEEQCFEATMDAFLRLVFPRLPAIVATIGKGSGDIGPFPGSVQAYRASPTRLPGEASWLMSLSAAEQKEAVRRRSLLRVVAEAAWPRIYELWRGVDHMISLLVAPIDSFGRMATLVRGMYLWYLMDECSLESPVPPLPQQQQQQQQQGTAAAKGRRTRRGGKRAVGMQEPPFGLSGGGSGGRGRGPVQRARGLLGVPIDYDGHLFNDSARFSQRHPLGNPFARSAGAGASLGLGTAATFATMIHHLSHALSYSEWDNGDSPPPPILPCVHDFAAFPSWGKEALVSPRKNLGFFLTQLSGHNQHARADLLPTWLLFGEQTLAVRGGGGGQAGAAERLATAHKQWRYQAGSILPIPTPILPPKIPMCASKPSLPVLPEFSHQHLRHYHYTFGTNTTTTQVAVRGGLGSCPWRLRPP